MALVQKLFEKGPQDTNYQIADDGGSLVARANSGTVRYSNLAKAHGNFGMRFVNGVSNACLIRYPVTTTSVASVSAVVSASAVDTQVIGFATNGGSQGIKIEYRPDDKWAMVGSSGVAYLMTTAGQVPAGTLFRVVFHVTRNTSTTGVATAKMYDLSGNQIGTTATTTTGNFGSAAYNEINIGELNINSTTNSASRVVTVDDLQWDDAIATELAPIGGQLFSAVRFGSTAVTAIYVGGTKVWP